MHEMMKQQCELEDQLVTAGISECKKAVIKRCQSLLDEEQGEIEELCGIQYGTVDDGCTTGIELEDSDDEDDIKDF